MEVVLIDFVKKKRISLEIFNSKFFFQGVRNLSGCGIWLPMMRPDKGLYGRNCGGSDWLGAAYVGQGQQNVGYV